MPRTPDSLNPEVARLVRRMECLATLIDNPAATDGERDAAALRYGEARNRLAKITSR